MGTKAVRDWRMDDDLQRAMWRLERGDDREMRQLERNLSTTVAVQKYSFVCEELAKLDQTPATKISPYATNGVPSKKDAAIEAVAETPGLVFATLIDVVCEKRGEDTDSMEIRRSVAGAVNSFADRGLIRRDDDDRFWPVAA